MCRPALAIQSALICALLIAGSARSPASACGHFVATKAAAVAQTSASHVVLLRNGNRTSLTLSTNYIGPLQDFALVVPVPVLLNKNQQDPESGRAGASGSIHGAAPYRKGRRGSLRSGPHNRSCSPGHAGQKLQDRDR